MNKLKIALFAAATLVTVPGWATEKDMCIPGIGGLAGTPTIDGVVDGYNGPGPISDAGWNNSNRWNLSGDNGATRSAQFQAGISGSSLYLSWVVDTPMSTIDDTIVLGISPLIPGVTPGTFRTQEDWRIFIQPFDVARVPGKSQTPKVVTWWRNSAGWPGGTAATPADWPKANTRFSINFPPMGGGTVGSRWALEMQIPLTSLLADAGLDTAVYLPNPGTFKIFTSVLSTLSSVTNMVVQDPWPPKVIICGNSPCPMDHFLTHNMPDITMFWGTASFNSRPDCDGVSISWSDIGVDFPMGTMSYLIRPYTGPFDPAHATDAICQGLAWNIRPADTGPSNTFIAKPFNEMTATTAKVSALFRLAPWGMPGVNEFDPIGAPAEAGAPAPGFVGVTGNPTMEQPINVGLHGSLTAQWKLSYKESCRFRFHQHDCMQVDIDSSDPATHFKNKSTQINMNFAFTSKFSDTALISGNRGKLPRGKKAHQIFVLVDTDMQVGREAEPPRAYIETYRKREKRVVFGSPELRAMVDKPYATSNLLLWLARGFYLDGNYVVINNTKYMNGMHAGDYAYVAHHEGPMTRWASTFTGDVRPVGKNVYYTQLALKKKARVVTTIESVGGRDNKPPSPQPR
jgi:hypothetical protein